MFYPKTFAVSMHVYMSPDFPYDLGIQEKMYAVEPTNAVNGLYDKYHNRPYDLKKYENLENEDHKKARYRPDWVGETQQVFKKNIVYVAGDFTPPDLPANAVIVRLQPEHFQVTEEMKEGKPRAWIKEFPMPPGLVEEWNSFKANSPQKDCGGYFVFHYDDTHKVSEAASMKCTAELMKKWMGQANELNILACNVGRVDATRATLGDLSDDVTEFMEVLLPNVQSATFYHYPVFDLEPELKDQSLLSQADRMWLIARNAFEDEMQKIEQEGHVRTERLKEIIKGIYGAIPETENEEVIKQRAEKVIEIISMELERDPEELEKELSSGEHEDLNQLKEKKLKESYGVLPQVIPEDWQREAAHVLDVELQEIRQDEAAKQRRIRQIMLNLYGIVPESRAEAEQRLHGESIAAMQKNRRLAESKKIVPGQKVYAVDREMGFHAPGTTRELLKKRADDETIFNRRKLTLDLNPDQQSYRLRPQPMTKDEKERYEQERVKAEIATLLRMTGEDHSVSVSSQLAMRKKLKGEKVYQEGDHIYLIKGFTISGVQGHADRNPRTQVSILKLHKDKLADPEMWERLSAAAPGDMWHIDLIKVGEGETARRLVNVKFAENNLAEELASILGAGTVITNLGTVVDVGAAKSNQSQGSGEDRERGLFSPTLTTGFPKFPERAGKALETTRKEKKGEVPEAMRALEESAAETRKTKASRMDVWVNTLRLNTTAQPISDVQDFVSTEEIPQIEHEQAPSETLPFTSQMLDPEIAVPEPIRNEDEKAAFDEIVPLIPEDTYVGPEEDYVLNESLQAIQDSDERKALERMMGIERDEQSGEVINLDNIKVLPSALSKIIGTELDLQRRLNRKDTSEQASASTQSKQPGHGRSQSAPKIMIQPTKESGGSTSITSSATGSPTTDNDDDHDHPPPPAFPGITFGTAPTITEAAIEERIRRAVEQAVTNERRVHQEALEGQDALHQVALATQREEIEAQHRLDIADREDRERVSRRNAVGELNDQVETLTASNTRLQSTLEERTNEIRQMRETYQREMRELRESMIQDREEFQQTLDDSDRTLDRERQDHEKRLDRLRQEHATNLEEQLAARDANHQAVVDQLNYDIEGLRRDIQRLTQQGIQSSNDYDRLSGRFNDIQERLTETTDQLNNRTSNLEVTIKQRDGLIRQANVIRQDRDLQIAAITQERDQARIQRNQLGVERNRYLRERDEARDEVTSLRREYGEVVNKFNRAMRVAELLQGELDNLRPQLLALQGQLQTAQTQLATARRDLATANARLGNTINSQPAVGTPMSIGSDLKDRPRYRQFKRELRKFREKFLGGPHVPRQYDNLAEGPAFVITGGPVGPGGEPAVAVQPIEARPLRTDAVWTILAAANLDHLPIRWALADRGHVPRHSIVAIIDGEITKGTNTNGQPAKDTFLYLDRKVVPNELKRVEVDRVDIVRQQRLRVLVGAHVHTAQNPAVEHDGFSIVAQGNAVPTGVDRVKDRVLKGRNY